MFSRLLPSRISPSGAQHTVVNPVQAWEKSAQAIRGQLPIENVKNDRAAAKAQLEAVDRALQTYPRSRKKAALPGTGELQSLKDYREQLLAEITRCRPAVVRQETKAIAKGNVNRKVCDQWDKDAEALRRKLLISNVGDLQEAEAHFCAVDRLIKTHPGEWGRPGDFPRAGAKGLPALQAYREGLLVRIRQLRGNRGLQAKDSATLKKAAEAEETLKQATRNEYARVIAPQHDKWHVLGRNAHRDTPLRSAAYWEPEVRYAEPPQVPKTVQALRDWNARAEKLREALPPERVNDDAAAIAHLEAVDAVIRTHPTLDARMNTQSRFVVTGMERLISYRRDLALAIQKRTAEKKTAAEASVLGSFAKKSRDLSTSLAQGSTTTLNAVRNTAASTLGGLPRVVPELSRFALPVTTASAKAYLYTRVVLPLWEKFVNARINSHVESPTVSIPPETEELHEDAPQEASKDVRQPSTTGVEDSPQHFRRWETSANVRSNGHVESPTVSIPPETEELHEEASLEAPKDVRQPSQAGVAEYLKHVHRLPNTLLGTSRNGLYHELQNGQNCGRHALNSALFAAGKQLYTGSEYQEFMAARMVLQMENGRIDRNNKAALAQFHINLDAEAANVHDIVRAAQARKAETLVWYPGKPATGEQAVQLHNAKAVLMLCKSPTGGIHWISASKPLRKDHFILVDSLEKRPRESDPSSTAAGAIEYSTMLLYKRARWVGKKEDYTPNAVIAIW